MFCFHPFSLKWLVVSAVSSFPIRVERWFLRFCSEPWQTQLPQFQRSCSWNLGQPSGKWFPSWNLRCQLIHRDVVPVPEGQLVMRNTRRDLTDKRLLLMQIISSLCLWVRQVLVSVSVEIAFGQWQSKEGGGVDKIYYLSLDSKWQFMVNIFLSALIWGKCPL